LVSSTGAYAFASVEPLFATLAHGPRFDAILIRLGLR
jgi:hypothetical protein